MRLLRRRRRDDTDRVVAMLDTAMQATYGRTLASLAPTTLPQEVVTEGDAEHDHELQHVPWDGIRLGNQMCDLDEEEHAKPGVAFPFATFKELYRCSCGREVITSQRHLL